MNNEEEPDLSMDDVDMEDDVDSGVVGDFPTIIDLVMDIFSENYHEGLEDEGWENVDCFQQIHSEVTLSECDATGSVFDEDGV